MSDKKVFFIMTDDEILNNLYINERRSPAFYQFIAERFAGGYDNVVSLACSKVDVAVNIMDTWLSEIPRRIPGVQPSDVSMDILFRGPKADKDVPNNTVILTEGCFKVKQPCLWTKLFPEDLDTPADSAD